MNTILIGSIASLAAGLATAIGAMPVFFTKTVSPRLADTFLGFAAGVMLAASFFSLLVPALAVAEADYGNRIAAASLVIASVLIGVGAIWLANEWAPHEHFVQGREGSDLISLKRIWLFVIAVTIHNFPEGLAVGVGFGGGDIGNGIALAVGIGLQNIPEGLAVAVALVGQRYARLHAFLVALLTGLIEPIGGVIGVTAVTFSQPLLPWALAFAAGAMIYVVSHEIIPATHSRGWQKEATAGLVVGLSLMMFLDVVLG